MLKYIEKRGEKIVYSRGVASEIIKEVSREEARIIVEEARNNANSIMHEALV